MAFLKFEVPFLLKFFLKNSCPKMAVVNALLWLFVQITMATAED